LKEYHLWIMAALLSSPRPIKTANPGSSFIKYLKENYYAEH